MITRREMLRGSLALGGAALFAPHLFAAAVIPKNRWFTERLGWSIGPQLFSFNRFSFLESIQFTVACGTNRCEAFGGQRFSPDIATHVGPDLLRPENRDTLRRVKDLLEENGCAIHAYGVCGGGRADFEFAAEFNIPLVNIGPGGNLNRMGEIDRLAEEYGCNVGLHNHPRPNEFWSPELVLELLKDTSPRMGACADTGHWIRSGLDPLECVRKLKGRITGFHVKDLVRDGNNITYVPFGQGEGKVAEILKEFATHDVRGPVPFSVEYETNWYNNQAEVAECVRFFDATARQIVTGA